jgi:electron transfer flavoprotein beta subunit
VDALTGVVTTDARTSGASDADDAALAWGLAMGAAWGMPVVAVTVGRAEADVVLRDPLALGAARAVRVQLDADGSEEGWGTDADDVAEALAEVARTEGAGVVVCGDLGLVAGSGAVPALVADRLAVPQALGLVDVTIDPDRPGALTVVRRLDRGRRERLVVEAPCVVSVEGGTRPLPRAGLPSVLTAGSRPVEVRTSPVSPLGVGTPALLRCGPYRPRTHLVPAPPADESVLGRVLALTGGDVTRTPPQTLVLDPEAAADRILAALHDWDQET